MTSNLKKNDKRQRLQSVGTDGMPTFSAKKNPNEKEISFTHSKRAT